MTRDRRKIHKLAQQLRANRSIQSSALSHWQQLRAAADRAGRLYDDSVSASSLAEDSLIHALGPGRSLVVDGVRYRCVLTDDGPSIAEEPANTTSTNPQLSAL